MSTSTAGARLTPVRRQYLTIKHSYPDAILLFRMGDFYECFDDDAKTLSQALEIALTARSMGKDTRIPMAGVPAVSLETNLARLIRQGYKVAICEQLSDPALSKGIVERGVVRVVTPGTVLESALLDQGANNYLAAICAANHKAGLAYVDVTTGEFTVAEIPVEALPLELARLEASEILIPPGYEPPTVPTGSGGEATVTELDASAFNPDVARRTLLDYYGVLSLEGYGLESVGVDLSDVGSGPLAMRAAGAVVDYLRYTWQGERPPLAPPRVWDNESHMVLDPQTRRNLELFEAGRRDSQDFSLLAALDGTSTAMGARLLRRWLGMPLLDLARLQRRLDAVQFFFDGGFRRDDTAAALSNVADLERILTRVRTQTSPPRDLLALRQSLAAAERLAPVLSGERADQVSWLADNLRPLPEVRDLLDAAIADEPSAQPGDGSVIRAGFSPDLDRVRAMASDARGFIASLEAKERERTGIRNLKVGYNQVFGYYIEVSAPIWSRFPTTTSVVKPSPAANATSRRSSRNTKARRWMPATGWSSWNEACTVRSASRWETTPKVSRVWRRQSLASMFSPGWPILPCATGTCARFWTTAMQSASSAAGTRWWSGCSIPLPIREAHSYPTTRPWTPTMPRSC